MSEVERHEMPSGTVTHYRDSDHQYNDSEGMKRDQRRLGASSVGGILDVNKDPLIDWGSKLTCEGMARQIQTVLSLPEAAEDVLAGWNSGEALWDLLKREGLTWRQIRDEAGFRGADSHEILRALAEGREGRVQTGYDEAVVAWWEEREPAVLQCEQVVIGDWEGDAYMPDCRWAGRFDLRCQVVNGGQTETWLLDLKTSGFISRSFAVQLNLYLEASQQSGFGGAERLMILQVRENGEWREVEVPKNRLWAFHALAAYESGKEIDRELRKAQKAADAAWEALNPPLEAAA